MKARPVLPAIDAAQRYSIAEIALYLRSSEWSVYRDIREGKLHVFKDRGRTYATGAELIRRSSAPNTSVIPRAAEVQQTA